MNKQLERDLKDIIFSLNSSQIIQLFKKFQTQIGINSYISYAKNGLKCCQCSINFQQFYSKGYGRDQNEALINSIKNTLESMISSNYNINIIKKALKHTDKGNSEMEEEILVSKNNKENYQTYNNRSSKLFSQQKQPLIKNPSCHKTSRKTQSVFNSLSKKKLSYNYEYGNENSANKENTNLSMNQTIDLANDTKIDLDASAISIGQASQGYLRNCSIPKSQNTMVKSQQDLQQKKISSQQLNSQKDQQDHCKCVYYEVHNHSKQQIKNLNARIRLLEEQNQMLKELLLKDFNSQLFKKNKNLNQKN